MIFQEFQPINRCNIFGNGQAANAPGGSGGSSGGGNGTHGGGNASTPKVNPAPIDNNGAFNLNRIDAPTPASMTFTGDALHQLVSGPSTGAADPGPAIGGAVGGSHAMALGKSDAVGDQKDTGSTAQAIQLSTPVTSVSSGATVPIPIVGLPGGLGSNPLSGDGSFLDLVEALLKAQHRGDNVNPSTQDIGGSFLEDSPVNATVKQGMGAVMVLAALGMVGYLVWKKVH